MDELIDEVFRVKRIYKLSNEDMIRYLAEFIVDAGLEIECQGYLGGIEPQEW
jgi:hypothetical protein